MESSQDPRLAFAERMPLLAPGRAASAGVQPYRHLNLSLGFALGADDTACCVHDWLWLLKLQPPKKKQMFTKTHISCTNQCRQASLVL